MPTSSTTHFCAGALMGASLVLLVFLYAHALYDYRQQGDTSPIPVPGCESSLMAMPD